MAPPPAPPAKRPAGSSSSSVAPASLAARAAAPATAPAAAPATAAAAATGGASVALLYGAAAVWIDAASQLRSVAFGLLEADCFVPSRGTSQFFGGYDANPHKAEAIMRQAMAVHSTSSSYIAGIEHNDLRIPTPVASSYVTHGQVPLGEWLFPLTLARRKHAYASTWPATPNAISSACT